MRVGWRCSMRAATACCEERQREVTHGELAEAPREHDCGAGANSSRAAHERAAWARAYHSQWFGPLSVTVRALFDRTIATITAGIAKMVPSIAAFIAPEIPSASRRARSSSATDSTDMNVSTTDAMGVAKPTKIAMAASDLARWLVERIRAADVSFELRFSCHTTAMSMAKPIATMQPEVRDTVRRRSP
jgi:hypothetical protein